MQILRTDFRGRGKWKRVADGLNAVGRCLNDMFGENGVDVDYHGGRLRISGAAGPGGGGGPGFPWHKLSFGYRLVHDTESDPPEWHARIYPGAIRMHGVAVYRLDSNPLIDGAGVEVTLAGVEPWVYAEVTRGQSQGDPVGIGISSNEPLTTTTTLRIPLYRFKQEGARYVLSHIANMGDINLDTPLL